MSESSTPLGCSPLVRGPRSGRFLAAFRLPDGDGRQVSLWDYRLRRNPVLFFHHGAACPRCRAELVRFSRHYAAYRERDAEILAISPDQRRTNAHLAASLGLPFPLLSDPEGSVAARQYAALGLEAGGVPLLLVASRVEEVWAAWAPDGDLAIPSQEEILSWLEFAVIQCHNGCGNLDWWTTADGQSGMPD